MNGFGGELATEYHPDFFFANMLSSATQSLNSMDACLGQRVKSILVAMLFMEINNQVRGNLPLGVYFCILGLQLCGGDGENLFLAIALLILWFKT